MKDVLKIACTILLMLVLTMSESLASDSKSLLDYSGHKETVSAVSLSADGTKMVSGGWDDTVRAWDPKSGRLLSTFAAGSRVQGLSMSRDGSRVACATSSGWQVRDTESGKVLISGAQGTWINSLNLSPDNRYLAIAPDDDSNVQILDANTGKCLRELKGHSYDVNSVVFSPDGSLIGTGSLDHTARLWEAATGKLLSTLESHQASIDSVVFSPDGQLFVSASADSTINVWNPTNGKLIRALDLTDEPNVVAFSDDGKLLLAGCVSNILLWNVSDYTSLGSIKCGPVSALVFDGVNDTIVACQHNVIRRFEPSTREPLRVVKRSPEAVLLKQKSNEADEATQRARYEFAQSFRKLRNAFDAQNAEDMLKFASVIAFDTRVEDRMLDKIAADESIVRMREKDLHQTEEQLRTLKQRFPMADAAELQQREFLLRKAIRCFVEALEAAKSALSSNSEALQMQRGVRLSGLEIYSTINLGSGFPAKSIRSSKEALLFCKPEARGSFEVLLALALCQMNLDDEARDRVRQLNVSALSPQCQFYLKYWAWETLKKEVSAPRNEAARAEFQNRLVRTGEEYIASLKAIASDTFPESALAAVARMELGSQLLRLGAIAKANETFEAADKQATELKTNPIVSANKQLMADFHLGNAEFLLERHKYAESIVELDAALPGLCEKMDQAQAKLDRAHCYLNLGDVTRARADFDSVADVLRNVPSLRTRAHELVPQFKLSDGIGDRWAVIVGIGDFADPSIPKLKFCRKDASDVRAFLVERAGFKPDHIKMLVDKDATRQNILNVIGESWLAPNVKPNDLVFFFISTHGSPAAKDVKALNYLIAYDTDKDHFFSGGIPMHAVVKELSTKINPGHVFVVLDTCYSGGLSADGRTDGGSSAETDVEQLLFSPSQIAVSSSSSKQVSWESLRYQNGIFTRQLLNALGKDSGFSEFRSLYKKVKQSVADEVKTDHHKDQTPTIAGLWNGVGFLKKGNLVPVPKGSKR